MTFLSFPFLLRLLLAGRTVVSPSSELRCLVIIFLLGFFRARFSAWPACRPAALLSLYFVPFSSLSCLFVSKSKPPKSGLVLLIRTSRVSACQTPFPSNKEWCCLTQSSRWSDPPAATWGWRSKNFKVKKAMKNDDQTYYGHCNIRESQSLL